ncbi:hypothetical protein ACMFMG_012106 [Clarireedia jacksonii]
MNSDSELPLQTNSNASVDSSITVDGTGREVSHDNTLPSSRGLPPQFMNAPKCLNCGSMDRAQLGVEKMKSVTRREELIQVMKQMLAVLDDTQGQQKIALGEIQQKLAKEEEKLMQLSARLYVGRLRIKVYSELFRTQDEIAWEEMEQKLAVLDDAQAKQKIALDEIQQKLGKEEEELMKKDNELQETKMIVEMLDIEKR